MQEGGKAGKQIGGRPLPEDLSERCLPEGGWEVRCAGSLPVVLTTSTFFSKTPAERLTILDLRMIYARYFAGRCGVPLPLKTGRFREAGAEFLLDDSADPAGPWTRFRVPRRIVVSGEASPRRP